MNLPLRLALLGVLIAIAITTTLDATGLTVVSALPLLPLTLLFWYLQRIGRAEIGLVWGHWRYYCLAVLYPVVVLGVMAVIAWASGVTDTSQTDWAKVLQNVALACSVGPLMVLLTEEGFFRGWLWASLKWSGQSDIEVLALSSVLFMLWHISAVTLTDEFRIPLQYAPIYLFNVVLLGAIWGIMRLLSGSVLVASVSHAVWNAGAYALFGFGEKSGGLGIKQSAIFGPERGLLGLLLNVFFLAALWYSLKQRNERESQLPSSE